MNQIVFYVIVSISGLIVGSFLNVCIYRMPRQQSIIRPASSCPNCKKRIKWFDNMPVVSFLLLRGRCRFCRALICVQYPLVEMLTAVIFCLNFFFFGFGFSFFVWCLFSASLIIASFIDLNFQLIPDIISIGGAVAGLGLSFFYPQVLLLAKKGAFLNSVAGALVGGGSIYLLGLVGQLIFKKESMGFGDVKLMAMIGAFLGWKQVLLCFFISPVLGSVWGLVLRIKYKKEIMPYGPFLALGSLVCLYWGKDILNFFLLSM